jgi:seryl-tRNA synthetase
MHDIRRIRENAAAFDASLARRGLTPQSPMILQQDEALRATKTTLQQLQEERNSLSKDIGARKKAGEDASALMARVNAIKEEQHHLEQQEREQEEQLTLLLSSIPNELADDVPSGRDESDNKEIRRWGTLPEITAPKSHDDLGEALGLMDFTAAAKMSGARFVVLKGALAQLERALIQFMLDVHTREFGYEEVSPPYLVRDNALYGTGQLPKFADDQFHTTNGYWLIPTAEVSVTNLVADTILDEAALPLRYVAATPCFRSEAGAAGRDTKGIIRQHQFWKVELVSITHPKASDAEHERLTQAAEAILQKLALPYRVMLLCAGDTGFSAHKTYDIEVWLPSQQQYREISSCSTFGAFQARRLKARYRDAVTRKNDMVHTLNGSGLAVGRCLVAIMENYQQADGRILVPDALQPYMSGHTHINAN